MRLFFNTSCWTVWVRYCWRTWRSITERWRCTTKFFSWCCIYLHSYIHRCCWGWCRCCRLCPGLFSLVSLCWRWCINPLWLVGNTYFRGCSEPCYFPASPASIAATFSLPRVHAAIPKIAPMEI